jgi:DNA mismatch endonuclease (patch repair protein)
MADVHTPEQRSYNMSRIKSNNTKPELLLRKLLWKNGIRGYRLKAKIFGKPDLYFPKYKLAIFVDGCFWHGCSHCKSIPETNNEFWIDKIKRNINRDYIVNKQLQHEKIYTIRFWEHEIKFDFKKCFDNLLLFLN